MENMINIVDKGVLGCPGTVLGCPGVSWSVLGCPGVSWGNQMHPEWTELKVNHVIGTILQRNHCGKNYHFMVIFLL